MSRVFEALVKAGEEKKRKDSGMKEGFEEFVDLTIPAENKEPDQSWRLGENGKAQKGKHPLRPLSMTKSWRERIEELLFGWDLRRYSNYPIVALEKESPASEQYKILREQVKRFRRDAGIRVLSITSPVKRDGKSTVAVNLAAALALDYEENVLLIDGDLRAPSVHRYFDLPDGPGLADYLGSDRASAGFESLVHETFLPGLSVLPAGKSTNFASELLAKDKMRQLMDSIRSGFPGHIVIDTPPILATPDPLVVARHVDGVLLVVRASKTPRDYVTKSVQLLNSTKLMGIVLNGTELGMGSKYYYYSYTQSN